MMEIRSSYGHDIAWLESLAPLVDVQFSSFKLPVHPSGLAVVSANLAASAEGMSDADAVSGTTSTTVDESFAPPMDSQLSTLQRPDQPPGLSDADAALTAVTVW